MDRGIIFFALSCRICSSYIIFQSLSVKLLTKHPVNHHANNRTKIWCKVPPTTGIALFVSVKRERTMKSMITTTTTVVSISVPTIMLGFGIKDLTNPESAFISQLYFQKR